MNKPLDDDFNDFDTVKINRPKESKGGAYAPADVPLIKDALYTLLKTLDKDDTRVTQAANLLHRLGRIS